MTYIFVFYCMNTRFEPVKAAKFTLTYPFFGRKFVLQRFYLKRFFFKGKTPLILTKNGKFLTFTKKFRSIAIV